jgi:2'-5' RNA ligase
LGDRLTVGQRPLKPLIGVRFPVSQQNLAKLVFLREKQIENLRQGIEGRSGLRPQQRLSRVADTRKVFGENFYSRKIHPSCLPALQIISIFSLYMENAETSITIVFRPSVEISDEILKVKKEINVYYPDHEDSFPHITLYSCKFDESKYSELLNVLSNLKISPQEFTLSELTFSYIPKRNYTFVYFDVVERNKLQNIHEIVLNSINPLRGDLVRNKDVERYKKGAMTESEFAFTQKYGFLYFMEKYNPHITIGVFTKEDQYKENILKVNLKGLVGKKFIADKIFVKLKKRAILDEKVIFESETTEIKLN